MVLPERRREVQISLPPVEEGLYDLQADGIAHQVVDSIEVVSPERAKKGFLFFLKEWHLLLQDVFLITALRSVGEKPAEQV